MEYAVGIILGIAVGIFSTVVGLDRDRALYPAILVVIASYYGLYAVLGGSNTAIVLETLVGLLFVAVAAVGFRVDLWIVAAGTVGHGIFDIFHHLIIENPGLPTWWPMFCMSIDITLGVYMAWLLWSKRVRVKPF
ncbi:MAG TPA: hypothetical protein PLN05_13260 [Pyrinomonadaceae bacterium]|nr:hypothetical protein [Chloracidobacterium sp.]HBE81554.1 hypothetical protein [Blastocatellia bacterium]HRJ87154.1 hypothetical protein [Pyrinomonadaceae bacterium]HRK51393.1 hypothetical protein [Pyrinomonadaceae bacterium]